MFRHETGPFNEFIEAENRQDSRVFAEQRGLYRHSANGIKHPAVRNLRPARCGN